MKKAFLGLLLVIMPFSLFSQSNKTQTDRRFSLQVNPIFLAADIMQLVTMTDDNAGEQSFLIGLEFQYALKDFLTLSLEPRFGIGNDLFFYGQGFGYGSNGVTFEDNYLWEESRVKYTLFTMNPGVLFRMPGSGLRGWYFGMYPTIGWKNASRDEYQGSPGVNDDFFILGITGGAGYQWIFKRGFTISLGHGLGRTWEIAGRGNTGIYDSSRRFLVDFIFNFKIGYSF